MTARDFYIAEIVQAAEKAGRLDVKYIMAKLDVRKHTAYWIIAAYRKHKGLILKNKYYK